MRNFLGIIFLLTCIIYNSFGQDKCHCQALIDTQYSGQVYIFDAPGGKIVDSLASDPAREDLLILTIQDVQGDYLKATVSLALSGKTRNGWIKKADYVGIYASNYDPDDPLVLYAKPDRGSSVVRVIDSWDNRLFTIKECKGDWLYVEQEYGGKTYSGWMEKKKQCPNPYTTCN